MVSTRDPNGLASPVFADLDAGLLVDRRVLVAVLEGLPDDDDLTLATTSASAAALAEALSPRDDLPTPEDVPAESDLSLSMLLVDEKVTQLAVEVPAADLPCDVVELRVVFNRRSLLPTRSVGFCTTASEAMVSRCDPDVADLARVDRSMGGLSNLLVYLPVEGDSLRVTGDDPRASLCLSTLRPHLLPAGIVIAVTHRF